jgi:hypothetical protein
MTPPSEGASAAEAFQGDFRSPVVSDLVQQVLNNQRLSSQMFYLVVLPEDGHPRMEQFSNVTSLIAKLQEWIDDESEISVFPFVGNYMPLTKGPNRFLVTPYGPLPLFEIPDPESMEIEEHGYVGPPQPDLPIPAVVDPPAAAGGGAAGPAPAGGGFVLSTATPDAPPPQSDDTPTMQGRLDG